MVGTRELHADSHDAHVHPGQPDDLTRREALVGALGVALAPAAVTAAQPTRRSRSRAGLLPDARAVDALGLARADLGLLEAAALLQSRRLSSVELTEACLARAENDGAGLHPWIRTYREQALVQARLADARLSARMVRRTGRRAPLVCGVPLGLKDIYAAAGLPLTAGSKILADQVAVRDSLVYERLRFFGMVLIGHNQTHEFAAGNFTPQCSNPWDPARTPGGSSGGSAIALAMRMVPTATGSDTLGSLRIPAGLCGVSTIKPTRGLVPLDGVIPLAPSFDHAGPMARSAADAALLLSYMTSDGRYLHRPASGARPLAGLRIGVPTGSFGGVPIDAGIAERTDAYATELASLGAKLVSFAAPRSNADNLSSSSGFGTFLTVPGHEIDAYHRRWFPQRVADYTPDVAFTLSLLRAANVAPPSPRTRADTLAALRRGWEDAFTAHRLNLVLQPAAVVPAPTKGQAMSKTQSIGDAMVVWDYLGWPVVCVPAGKARDGLPVGVQLIGRPGAEDLLCRTAITTEAPHPHFQQRPAAAAKS